MLRLYMCMLLPLRGHISRRSGTLSNEYEELAEGAQETSLSAGWTNQRDGVPHAVHAVWSILKAERKL